MTPMQIVGLHQAAETLRTVWRSEWLNRHFPGPHCQGSICLFFRAAEDAGIISDPDAQATTLPLLSAGEPLQPMQCTVTLPEHLSGVLERVLLAIETNLRPPPPANVPNPPKPAEKPAQASEAPTRRKKNFTPQQRQAAADRMREMRRRQTAGTQTDTPPASPEAPHGAAEHLVQEAAPAPIEAVATPTAQPELPAAQPALPTPPPATTASRADRTAWDEAADLLAAGMSGRQVAAELKLPLGQVGELAARLREARTAARKA